MIKQLKRGFSLVEVMILFTVMAVVLAASLPVITKKNNAIPRKVSHGVYRCIAQGNHSYLEETYNSFRKLSSNIVYDTVDEEGNITAHGCKFIPPHASTYKIDLYSAGAGGTKFGAYQPSEGSEVRGAFTLDNAVEYAKGRSASGKVYKTPNDVINMPYSFTAQELQDAFRNLRVKKSNFSKNATQGGSAKMSYKSPKNYSCLAAQKLYSSGTSTKGTQGYSDAITKADKDIATAQAALTAAQNKYTEEEANWIKANITPLKDLKTKKSQEKANLEGYLTNSGGLNDLLKAVTYIGGLYYDTTNATYYPYYVAANAYLGSELEYRGGATLYFMPYSNHEGEHTGKAVYSNLSKEVQESIYNKVTNYVDADYSVVKNMPASKTLTPKLDQTASQTLTFTNIANIKTRIGYINNRYNAVNDALSGITISDTFKANHPHYVKYGELSVQEADDRVLSTTVRTNYYLLCMYANQIMRYLVGKDAGTDTTAIIPVIRSHIARLESEVGTLESRITAKEGEKADALSEYLQAITDAETKLQKRKDIRDGINTEKGTVTNQVKTDLRPSVYNSQNQIFTQNEDATASALTLQFNDYCKAKYPNYYTYVPESLISRDASTGKILNLAVGQKFNGQDGNPLITYSDGEPLVLDENLKNRYGWSPDDGYYGLNVDNTTESLASVIQYGGAKGQGKFLTMEYYLNTPNKGVNAYKALDSEFWYVKYIGDLYGDVPRGEFNRPQGFKLMSCDAKNTNNCSESSISTPSSVSASNFTWGDGNFKDKLKAAEEKGVYILKGNKGNDVGRILAWRVPANADSFISGNIVSEKQTKDAKGGEGGQVGYIDTNKTYTKDNFTDDLSWHAWTGTSTNISASSTSDKKGDDAVINNLSGGPVASRASYSIGFSHSGEEMVPELMIKTQLSSKSYRVGNPGSPGNYKHVQATALGSSCTIVVPQGGKVFDYFEEARLAGSSLTDLNIQSVLKERADAYQKNLGASITCYDKTGTKEVFSTSVDGGSYNVSLSGWTSPFVWSKTYSKESPKVVKAMAPVVRAWMGKASSVWAKIFKGGNMANIANVMTGNNKAVGEGGTGTTLSDACVAPKGLFEYKTQYRYKKDEVDNNGNVTQGAWTTLNISNEEGTNNRSKSVNLEGISTEFSPSLDCYNDNMVKYFVDGENNISGVPKLTETEKEAYKLSGYTPGGGGAIVISW